MGSSTLSLLPGTRPLKRRPNSWLIGCLHRRQRRRPAGAEVVEPRHRNKANHKDTKTQRKPAQMLFMPAFFVSSCLCGSLLTLAVWRDLSYVDRTMPISKLLFVILALAQW